MAAAPSPCGEMNRRLDSLLQALGSPQPDAHSGTQLNEDCKHLLDSTNRLASLEGSADELAALQR
jgi:hypothetical protein